MSTRSCAQRAPSSAIGSTATMRPSSTVTRIAPFAPVSRGMSALQIAGIDDPGIAMDDRGGVDMAERPIIVAEAGEVGDRAGRVGSWPGGRRGSVCSTPILSQPSRRGG